MNATRKTSSRRTTSTRRRSTSTRRRTTTRRRRPTVAASVGSAIGLLIVSTLLKMSWPMRIGLVVLGLLVVVGYVLWRNRAEIAASADDVSAVPPATGPDTAAEPSTAVQPSSAESTPGEPTTPESPS